MRRAFDNIYDHSPMFASFVMKWNIIETREVPYAATDGPNLYLNPDFMNTLNMAEVLKVVKHEAGHIFLGHMYRVPLDSMRDAVEHHEWNVALDEALNDTIAAHDSDFNSTGDKIADILIFPGRMHKTAGSMFYSHPKGKDAEFYHDLVKKSRPPQPPPQPGPGRSGGSEKGEKDTSTGKIGNEPEAGSPGAEKEGSGNDKIPTVPELPVGPGRVDLPESFGDVLPHPVLEDEDDEKIEESIQEWKQEVARSINNARQQGDLPGWVKEIADQIYGQQSKQNWRALLRRWMTRVVAFGGETYDRPNRRQSWRRDIIIPAKQSRQASIGLGVTDTSGSMSKPQCDLALSEMEAVLRTFPRCEVDLMMADTRLIEYKKTFHRYDFPLRLPVEWQGRGGTNLSEPIMRAAASRRYKWIVVISDMEWRVDQAVDPRIPVIWVWTPKPGVKELQAHQKPKFGLLIGPVNVEKQA